MSSSSELIMQEHQGRLDPERLRIAARVQIRDAKPLNAIQSYIDEICMYNEVDGALVMLCTDEDVPLAISDLEFSELDIAIELENLLFQGEVVEHDLKKYLPLFSEEKVVGYLRIRFSPSENNHNEALYNMASKLISKELELAHSVSELAYQNEQVHRKKRELQEVINLKNNILSVTTHDLKNPISAIQGFTDLLQENIRAGKTVEEESEVFMKNIRKGINNVSELVQQLNEVALLELNQLDIQSVTVDINWLLREEAELLKIQADKKSQHFFVETSKFPIYVDVDLPKCKRIIFNIIGNAIKYTPERGTIRIWTESDQSICKIHIKDSGIGIAQDKIDSIFEPFRKLRSKGTSGEFSSGLGLFISNYLVRLFKGSIQVESSLGNGSVFTILLPVVRH